VDLTLARIFSASVKSATRPGNELTDLEADATTDDASIRASIDISNTNIHAFLLGLKVPHISELY
jgi:hypothetical protein